MFFEIANREKQARLNDSTSFSGNYLSILILSLTIILLVACQNKQKENISSTILKDTLTSISTANSINTSADKEEGWQKHQQSFRLENFLVSSLPSSDYLTINDNAAIFIFPDSLQIMGMRERYSEEDFYTIADDNSYYISQARSYCEKKKIKIVDHTNRYIKFVTKTKEIYFDTKAKASLGFMAILFKTDGLPKIINAINIATEYNHYFQK